TFTFDTPRNRQIQSYYARSKKPSSGSIRAPTASVWTAKTRSRPCVSTQFRGRESAWIVRKSELPRIRHADRRLVLCASARTYRGCSIIRRKHFTTGDLRDRL